VKAGVAETGEPASGKRAYETSVGLSVFTDEPNIPELIGVPRLGKSPYGTNLGVVSAVNYVESVYFSVEAHRASELGIGASYL